MISLKTVHRSAAAKASHYYADQKDDYYSRDGTAAQWQGKAGEALGLTGEVRPEHFLQALRGEFGPSIQLASSVRQDSKARAALDITFSPPKSVSIQALVGRDASVIDAHDRAVTKALDFIEGELLRARQTSGGVTTMEQTGNALIAKFRHETARPTSGAYSDPQLHTHALLMNITQRSDGTWAAIANDEIYRLKPMAEAVYNASLVTELEKSGKSVRYEGKGFELASITRKQIEAFSKRTHDINAGLEAVGHNRQTASRALKQTIALKTRLNKTPEISRDALQADWRSQAKEAGISFGRPDAEAALALGASREAAPASPGTAVADGASLPNGTPPPEAQKGEASALIADECIKWAIKHHTERESVMEGKDLLKTALRRSHGTGLELKDLKSAVKRFLDKGHLILGTLEYRPAHDRKGAAMSRTSWVESLVAEGKTPGQAEAEVRKAMASGALVLAGAKYTTQVAREREKRILQIEKEGRGMLTPILQPAAAKAAMAAFSLRPGQRAAAELILSTTDRFVGVQGLAGTGKSHMLEKIKQTAEAAGYVVQAVASYGKQIEALRDLGIEAKTVASVLEARQKDRFKLDARTVLVIDEAGVVPTRILERLMKMAETDGARVVMMGDVAHDGHAGQTKAIEAGRPFHQLLDAGMAKALMGDIVRQKSVDLKASVELAAKGQAVASLQLLDQRLQAVHTVAEDDIRYDTIAKQYAGLDADARRETLIITGTNDSRNSLNEAAHEALGLAGRGFHFDLLTRRDTTQAERRVAKYYVAGDIIQPERDYKAGSLKQGEMYRVVGPVRDKPNLLEVEHLGTKGRIQFNPARTAKISVYEPVRAELSAGDWVRVTRNNAALDLVNGGRFEVLAVTPTTVTIGDGTRRISLPASEVTPLHLDRAYATTSHSSQGLTCDRVLINAESFSRTTQKDVYYVAISRARHRAEIYTNDASKLSEAISRLEQKTAALDIGIESTRPWRQKDMAHGRGFER
ncbi:MobF family relaxase [Achromobacter sp. 413638]|uniref:MobF family relaxase n=1 Tax=Achromobacter sp. 413638 TaxID=3342385 RepID=UPI00370C673D